MFIFIWNRTGEIFYIWSWYFEVNFCVQEWEKQHVHRLELLSLYKPLINVFSESEGVHEELMTWYICVFLIFMLSKVNMENHISVQNNEYL